MSYALKIAQHNARQVGVIELRMNTPGGLDTSMRQIISAILASPVPVITYVAPSGARAASAGTYIAYASAIAAMAPGTNIGAATPVQLGGPMLPGGAEQKQSQQQDKTDETGDTETRKVVNDAIAYIRSLAALNGRNADWAADAVRSAVSLPAVDALSLHVIDVIANDVPDLLRQIDGRTVMIAGKPLRLATVSLEVATVPPDWRTELLALITNPNVAFILLLIGVYGLILEFFNPGAVAPGLIGAISLFVALYALALLPINGAYAALVLIGIGLMIAEAHIGAFGAIGVGGAGRRSPCCALMKRRKAGPALSELVVDDTRYLQRSALPLGTGGAAALAQATGSDRRRSADRGAALARRCPGKQGGEGMVRVKGENLAGAARRAARRRHPCQSSRSRRPRHSRPTALNRELNHVVFPADHLYCCRFCVDSSVVFQASHPARIRMAPSLRSACHTGTKGPGLFLLVPFIQQMVRVDLRVIVDEESAAVIGFGATTSRSRSLP